jgi:hypothetical protein
MLARLVGLSPQSLYQARFHRRHNGAGHKSNGSNGHQPKPTLADMLASASAEERAEAAARLGPAVVWDQMISPLLDQERGASQAAE